MHDFNALRYLSLERYLRRHIQGEVRFDKPSRLLYSTDASIYRIEPLGVVIPKSVQDLQTAVAVASEMHIPVTVRGGGTSLSGQAIGPGIIVDCAKYLNRIVEVDIARRVAVVEPGVVLDQLNRTLEPFELQFGPDVSTASRACLGGMIGNNSAGSRSIVYGKTGDHVRRLEVFLANGSSAVIEPLNAQQWQRKTESRNLEGGIYREVQRILNRDADEIRRRFPNILRRVSGYNLEGVLRQPEQGLLPLIVGSEGTLAVLARAELALVTRPRHRGLLVPHFASLADALNALHLCLASHPSAVELLDAMLIALAREQPGLRRQMAAIQGTPAALLMIEFADNDESAVSDRLQQLQCQLHDVPGLTACVTVLKKEEREPLWSFRRAAVPLLYGIKGERKPVAFVEDPAVAPARLPEFVARFRELLRRYGTDGAFYGHASVGCLHIRPLMNLKDVNDVRRMRQISQEVADLVLSFGGSMSGEHGDGLSRSEWNRRMFGPVVYEAFRQVKRAFDPDGILNPGKVVDAPPMTDNLRYHDDYRPTTPPTIFDYSKQEGFFASIELCNGSGVCRKTQGGMMCPSYRATRDERDSTRGRANALREAIGSPKLPSRERLAARWLFDVMDLCLSCKACKTECPSNVDMAKLKSEFLHAYYSRRPRPPGHYLLANVHYVQSLGAELAPLVNWIGSNTLLRWVMEKSTGIDRRRSLPPLHWDHFRRWFRRQRLPKTGPRVVLLDDCFTTFNEPHIGQAAVRLLTHAGFSVELAGIPCCGRPQISKGFLAESRELAKRGVARLSQFAAEGVPILGIEPSCALTLVDEWPELLPDPAARRVAGMVELADEFVSRRATSWGFRPRDERCLVQPHCHQRSLRGPQGPARALQRIPRLEVHTLDAGCCGMAGAFGYEYNHYDLSVQIAQLGVMPALKAEPDALVLASGTSCRHQIKDTTGRRALHPLELLAESLSPQSVDE